MLAGGFAAGVFGSLLGLGRRRAHRAAAHARLRARPALGRRRVARVRDHDEQRGGRGLPRAARRQPPPRDEPGAVHGHRGPDRGVDRVPHRRACPVRSCSRCSSATSPSRWSAVAAPARRTATRGLDPGRRPRSRTDRRGGVRRARQRAPRGRHAHGVPGKRFRTGLRGPQARHRDRRVDRGRGGVRAAGHRRRDHQGPADEPRDGRAACAWRSRRATS